ncbi:MAG TPA: oligosaccharide flippase family protein [Anaerolineales bacterium]|nr:oligosaccharide flippase family protein [Anaerolineales bacterium]
MLQALRSRLSAWIGDASLKRLIKNASMLFGAETLVTLIGVVQFPLVTRWLGVENYGAWGIVSSWVGLVAQILSFRLWETVIKYLSQFTLADDEPRALAILKLCLFIDFTVAAVTFVVISASADMAARFVLQSRPDGADLIRLEAFNVLAGVSMSVWVAVLRVFDRFRHISVYNVFSAVAILVSWMAAFALGAGVGGIILATALVKIGQTLVLALLARRDLRRRFQENWLSADLGMLRGYRREIGVMLFAMNVDALRKIATGNADMVILGWLATPAQAGVYRLAKQLASYFGRLTNPLYDTLYPEVARLYAAEGPARVRALVWKLMRGVLVGLVASLAGAYALSPWLVPPIFGPEYVPAIPLFYILVLTNLWVILLWAPSVLISAGKTRQLTTINTICSLLLLILLLVLTPLWGSTGAAVAQVCFYLIWLMLVYPVARQVLKV